MQNEEILRCLTRALRFCILHSAFYISLLELKPQQTGTGLLIRYGEVATTSGSTNSIHCGME